jgi:hypothetical protein
LTAATASDEGVAAALAVQPRSIASATAIKAAVVRFVGAGMPRIVPHLPGGSGGAILA